MANSHEIVVGMVRNRQFMKVYWPFAKQIIKWCYFYSVLLHSDV